MAQHDPELQYQAELDRRTREKAGLIVEALGIGSKLNTQAMIEDLALVLGDDQALGELIKCTARGENALLELLKELALDAAENAARAELRDAPARRQQHADEARIDQVLDARAAA
jgi:hypothetical protein